MGLVLFPLIILTLLLLYGVLFFRTSKKACLVFFLILFLFTNPILSMFSGVIDSKIFFNFYQGLDFAFIMFIVFFIVIYNKKNVLAHLINSTGKLYIYSFAFLFLFYSVYGFYNNGFIDFLIYFRMLFYPILLLVFGLWLSLNLESVSFIKILFSFFVFVAFYLFLEMFAPYYLYSLLDADSYYKLKSGYSSLNIDELLSLREKRFLNLKFFENLKIFKPAGPTFNYPSTSYIIVLFLALSLALSNFLLFFCTALILLLLGTKAGILSASVLILSWVCYRFNRPLRARSLIVLGVIYSLLSLWFLFLDKSIHAYSLISSIINLLKSPFGQGIGFGGAMTVERIVTHQFDMLVGDSGVAIVINMFGIFGIILYLFYFKYLSSMISSSLADKNLTLYLAAVFGFITLFNSLTQELAIGPYALGLSLFVCAFLSGQQSVKGYIR